MIQTILIVEAEKTGTENLKHIFSADYSCLIATNCPDALSALHQSGSTISAVLLDMTTVADGEKLIRHVGQNEELSQIPVLVTVDAGKTDRQATALSLGAVFCLHKPYDPVALRALLRNLLRLCRPAAIGCSLSLDNLTGLFNREAFFGEAEQLIQSHPPGYFAGH